MSANEALNTDQLARVGAVLIRRISEQITRPPHDGLPRLAYSKAEAAEALGVSVDFLEKHVMPELDLTRRGRRWLIPVVSLERWLNETASRALDSGGP